MIKSHPLPTLVSCFAIALLGGACFKPLDAPLADIPKLASLEDVMHANETVGSQTFKLGGKDAYEASELATLSQNGARFAALGERGKAFSRGPIYDKYSDQLASQGKALAAAAEAKDAKAASQAISDIKGTCKSCHSETR